MRIVLRRNAKAATFRQRLGRKERKIMCASLVREAGINPYGVDGGCLDSAPAQPGETQI
jgi:hypothetical protein